MCSDWLGGMAAVYYTQFHEVSIRNVTDLQVAKWESDTDVTAHMMKDEKGCRTKLVQVREILQEVLEKALQEEAVMRTTTSWKPSKVTQMRQRTWCRTRKGAGRKWCKLKKYFKRSWRRRCNKRQWLGQPRHGNLLKILTNGCHFNDEDLSLGWSWAH